MWRRADAGTQSCISCRPPLIIATSSPESWPRGPRWIVPPPWGTQSPHVTPLKILSGSYGKLVGPRGIDTNVRRHDDERYNHRPRPRALTHSDIAAGAADSLDIELVSQLFRELLSARAGEDSAGRRAHTGPAGAPAGPGRGLRMRDDSAGLERSSPPSLQKLPAATASMTSPQSTQGLSIACAAVELLYARSKIICKWILQYLRHLGTSSPSPNRTHQTRAAERLVFSSQTLSFPSDQGDRDRTRCPAVSAQARGVELTEAWLVSSMGRAATSCAIRRRVRSHTSVRTGRAWPPLRGRRWPTTHHPVSIIPSYRSSVGAFRAAFRWCR